jgi:hypothetical protein
MVVSWISLSYSEARGFVSHYTVAYFCLNRSSQTLEAITQAVPGMDANTTRIEGLDANTDCIVQVSATNGAGTSDLSSPALAVAPMQTEGSHDVHLCSPHAHYYTVYLTSSGVDGAVVGTAVVLVIALLVVAALILIIMMLLLKNEKN